jgi:hypothetical protein
VPNYLGFRKQKSDRRDDPSGPDFVKVHRIVAFFSQPGEWQKLFSLFFSREEEQLLFRAAIFAQQKTNAAEQESDRHVIKSHQGGKYATPDFTRGRIDDGPLRADHRRLFMLCWTARASDVLIRPARYLMAMRTL